MAAAQRRGPPEPAGPDGAQPLRGLTFLNPRAADDAADLTQALTRLGAEVIEQPTIAFAPPESWQPFDARLRELSSRDWIVFTSATAVRFVRTRLGDLGRAPRDLATARIAAVGVATAAALEAEGLPVAAVPETFQAEGLLEALLPRLRPGDRLWLPRAEQGRETLPAGLRRAGYEVAVTPVYRTVMPAGGLGAALDALRLGRLDWLVFTSPSTVGNFVCMLPPDVQPPALGTGARAPRVACLGEVTASRARELGFRIAALPSRQDLPGLVAAIVKAVQPRAPQDGR
jgi:uroporphyrinogen III methyltransferase/synthase